ncbi:transglycosylase SLT domain-containing protein [Candidatus Amoebophilus asiaticus]|nr:transglycosylase SLT domain-containing protein [Candidatus Amoebophilus asiaticus]
MRNAFVALIGVFTLFVTVKIFSFGTDISDADFQKQFIENYKIYPVYMPDQVNFAGEWVPLGDFDVKERLDRELLVNTYYQSHTLLLHKRANRWFPLIETILKKHKIPDDFKYLALAESGLSNVVSPKKAVGFWQILEGTAKQYGLEVNKEIDERYNVVKATEAACKYLLHSYDIFQNWTLVAASYNMGISGVKRQLRRQKENSYYDLILNSETYRYVLRLVALKEIITNPAKYGYIFREKDLYQPVPTYHVSIDSSVSNFGDFAHNYGISYKMLKIFNPWIRQSYLNNKDGKVYEISLPKSIINYNEELEKQLIHSNIPEYLKTDTIASTPLDYEHKEERTGSQEENQPTKTSTEEEIWHTVKKGEDINLIAKKYNVTVKNIILWNQLEETYLLADQELFIFAKPKEKEEK